MIQGLPPGAIVKPIAPVATPTPIHAALKRSAESVPVAPSGRPTPLSPTKEPIDGFHFGPKSVTVLRPGGERGVVVQPSGTIGAEASAAGQKTYPVKGKLAIASVTDPHWQVLYKAALAQAQDPNDPEAKSQALNSVEKAIKVAGYDGYRSANHIFIFGDAKSQPYPSAADEAPKSTPGGGAPASAGPKPTTNAQKSAGAPPRRRR